MNSRIVFVIATALFLLACSDSASKGGKGFPTGNNSSNSCGDGALNPGETCDPEIPEGTTGACPTSCSAPDSCSSASLQGSASSCNLECVNEPIACADGDGCCPEGCDAMTDDDCSNLCGDGIVEGGETCDGDCPTSCEAPDSCTTSTLSGSAEACSAACEYTPITACVDDDGCCPSGCDERDSDCSCEPDDPCASRECGTATNSCGTPVSCGTCGSGEACSAGVCEATFDIGEPCFNDAACNEICLDDRETFLVGGYCSATCRTDADCPTGSVCNDSGNCLLSCSTESDCPRSEYICADFRDVSTDVCFVGGTGSGDVGDSCTAVGDCSGGGDALCVDGYPDGYCSLVCNTNGDCSAGSHCYSGYCVKTCTRFADCRSEYGCVDRDLDGAKECLPEANGPGEVSSPCTDYRDCSGGIYGICMTGANFPGGYCTSTCSVGACPLGTFCATQFEVPICLAYCNSSFDCRYDEGYACEDFGNANKGCVDLL